MTLKRYRDTWVFKRKIKLTISIMIIKMNIITIIHWGNNILGMKCNSSNFINYKNKAQAEDIFLPISNLKELRGQ